MLACIYSYIGFFLNPEAQTEILIFRWLTFVLENEKAFFFYEKNFLKLWLFCGNSQFLTQIFSLNVINMVFTV